MFERKTYGWRFFASLRMTAMLGIVAALWSCAKVSDDRSGEQLPVTFSTYGLRPTGTKADASYVAPGADFTVGSVVGVYGFYHDDSDWDGESDEGINIPDFMYHTALTKQDDGTWSYSPIKYWPNEYGAGANSDNVDKLSFWGYYPRIAEANYTTDTPMYSGTDAVLRFWESDGTAAYSNGINGIPKATFTQSTDPDKMVDLMFSELENDLTKPGINENVTLHFRHALALVEFQLAEGTGAEVNSLSLTEIKKTGTCANPSAASIAWTDIAGSFDISMTSVTVTGSTLLRILAIPQDIDPDAAFTLNYNIQFASSDPSHPEPIVYTGESADAKLFKTGTGAYGVSKWEAGKHYIYKISAGLDRIEFEEIVEAGDDWTVGKDNISVPES